MNIKKIILGTVQLGTSYGINNTTGKPSEEEAFDILDFCHASGIQFLDTAEAYGESQAIIGRFFKKYPEKTFQILTKFKGGSSPIREQLKKTLEDLNLKKIHTYSFHQFSDLQNESIRTELQALKNDGLISQIGVSIYTNEEFSLAIELDFINTIQIPFNLLDNWKQKGALISKAKAKGKEIHARSTFLQGLFYKHMSELPASLKELSNELQQIKILAETHHLSINQLALQYVLSFQEIDKFLIGVETKNQLVQNLESLNGSLEEKLKDQISNLHIASPSLLDPRNWK